MTLKAEFIKENIAVKFKNFLNFSMKGSSNIIKRQLQADKYNYVSHIQQRTYILNTIKNKELSNSVIVKQST